MFISTYFREENVLFFIEILLNSLEFFGSSIKNLKVFFSYVCSGTWTGICHPRRTRRPIDMCPRAIQAIHTCVATLAFIIIIGYHRPPVIRTKRISGSADSHTRRPAGWAAVPGPAAPAARRLISARRSPRPHC